MFTHTAPYPTPQRYVDELVGRYLDPGAPPRRWLEPCVPSAGLLGAEAVGGMPERVSPLQVGMCVGRRASLVCLRYPSACGSVPWYALTFARGYLNFQFQALLRCLQAFHAHIFQRCLLVVFDTGPCCPTPHSHLLYYPINLVITHTLS